MAKEKMYHPHTKIKDKLYTQTLSFITRAEANAYAKKRSKEGYKTIVKKEGGVSRPYERGKSLYTVYIRRK